MVEANISLLLVFVFPLPYSTHLCFHIKSRIACFAEIQVTMNRARYMCASAVLFFTSINMVTPLSKRVCKMVS